MQSVRAEGSLLASLAELKRIEQQRIADEQAAIQRTVDERRAAAEEAERKEREAAEAKLRAEHHAKVALEEARAAAEREARMRVEAAEMAERVRAQTQLEQQRMVEELRLKREVAARQRPTWMVVVTAIAMVVAAVLAWAALGWKHQADVATIESTAAINAKREAQEQAKRSAAKLAEIESELAEQTRRVDEAVRQVAIATDRAKLKEAQDRLAMLQRDQARLDEKKRKEKALLEKAIRDGGYKVNDDCLKNPLCNK